MPILGTPNRSERDASIKRHQPAIVLDRQRKKKCIGDLIGPEKVIMVKDLRICDRNAGRPKLVPFDRHLATQE